MSKKKSKKLSDEEVEKLYPNEKYISDYSAVTPGFLRWLSVGLLVLTFVLAKLGILEALPARVNEISNSGRFSGR